MVIVPPVPPETSERVDKFPRPRVARWVATSASSRSALPAAVTGKVDQVLVPVRSATPVVVRPSRAPRSSAKLNVIDPDPVIGPPLTVRPADGAVRPTLVTVPVPRLTQLKIPLPSVESSCPELPLFGGRV